MIVRSFLGKDRLTGVGLESPDGKDELDLDVNGVFLEVGLTPNTDPIAGLIQLNERAEVPVNKDQSSADIDQKTDGYRCWPGALAVLSAHKCLVQERLTKSKITPTESWQ